MGARATSTITCRIGATLPEATFVAAIDQGTTSTRCMIFGHAGDVIARDQKEHGQIYPRPGWVEHNPEEIWQRTREVIAEAMSNGKLQPKDLAAVGITQAALLDSDLAVGRAYGVTAYPVTVFVRADGSIDARQIGQLDERVLLAELSKLSGQ